MRIKLKLATLCFCLFSGELSNLLADQAHDLFQSLEGIDYYGGLPESIAPAVIVEMLAIPVTTREEVWAHQRILEYLAANEKNVKWTENLQKAVHSDKNNPNQDIQISWVEFTLTRNDGANKREILDLLSTAGEDVRKHILIRTRSWPDHDAIWTAYIQNSKGNDASRGSVQTAKNFLKQESQK